MKKPVICIGSALVDELYFCKEHAIAGTSNPAISKKFPGGVISNIARHLSLLEIPTELITVLGKDSEGNWLKDQLIKDGVEMKNSFMVNDNTGKYVSFLNPDGSLYAAACSDICADHLNAKNLELVKQILQSAALIITDTNTDISTIEWLINFCRKESIKIIIEPVSIAKARKLAQLNLDKVFMITPNEDELNSLCVENHDQVSDAINELINRGVENVWLRQGASGSVFHTREKQLQLKAASIQVKDSTGAGDAALAGWVAAYMENQDLNNCMTAGHTLAFEVLQTEGAVKTDINKQTLFESIQKYYTDAIK